MTRLGQALIAAVKEVAKESPLEKDRHNKYFHNGEPACILGRALEKVGIADGLEDSYMNELSFSLLWVDGILDISPDEGLYLDQVQRFNDSGRVFADCIPDWTPR